MGRAVFGVFFGIAIVVVAIVAVRRWAPSPGKDIEWVHSDASIIVQMKSSGGDGPHARLPLFTLYGDGTLIVDDMADTCLETLNACETALQTKLSSEQVGDLLRFISDKGFFNFSYAQPQPSVSGAPTVFIFAASKDSQNATRANALGFDAPQGKGTDWGQFNKLVEIAVRLESLRDDAISGGHDFIPDEGLLYVQPVVLTDVIGVSPWPYAQIDIASAAPGREAADYHLSHDELTQLGLPDLSATTCWCEVQAAGRGFSVYYRPILPHEDNFPEFEPPS